MPTLDLRPRALDFRFRPEDSYSVRLNGPVGWLTGRTFSATLGGVSLGVTNDADTLVVDVDGAVTASHSVGDGGVDWVLHEVGANDVLVGKWTPSAAGAPSQTVQVDVLLASAEVDLTISLLIGDVVDGGTWVGSGPDVLDGGGW